VARAGVLDARRRRVPAARYAGPLVAGVEYDGHRCRIVSERSGRVRLVSRGGRTVTAAFPDVAGAVTDVLGGRMAVLDGELVAPGPGGRPDFERLQARARTRATPSRVAATPVVFVAFDLLALDGVYLTARPMHGRRDLLEELDLGRDPRLLLSPVFVDVDPDVLLAVAREHGVEGLVSKRVNSLYSAGARSKAWIKTVLTETREFVVCGVARGGARARRRSARCWLAPGRRAAGSSTWGKSARVGPVLNMPASSRS